MSAAGPAPMLASLPMYDLPELAAATDSWWRGLAAAFRRAGLAEVPGRLTREVALPAHWLDPALLFSQTCGYPLTHALAGRVGLLGTPCYAAPGCEGPLYRSLVLVAEGSPARSLAELRGQVAAMNGRDSQSGCNVLRALLAPHAAGGRFCGAVLETGSHAASIAAVAAGRAGFAAIDCVTHALLARRRPAALAGTRVLLESPAVPGLPYVAGGAVDEDGRRRLRDGLRAAFADPGLAETRDALLLAGFDELPLAAYDAILAMRRQAEAAGYPELA
ncbi:MAG: PhnD/SsuA/transferrin family substrate-binding protein [Dongiaceae bacterium]